MAVAEAAGRLAAPPPRRWWRSRTGLVLAIVVGMVIAFFGWRNQLVWPGSFTWNSLSHHLDSFQTWLSNNRNVPHPSVFFRAFNGLANFLDNLVGWLTSLFFKLTWAGTTALGVLVVLRFGGRRAALGTAAAFVSFAAMGLWESSMRTFALTLASVGFIDGIAKINVRLDPVKKQIHQREPARARHQILANESLRFDPPGIKN